MLRPSKRARFLGAAAVIMGGTILSAVGAAMMFALGASFLFAGFSQVAGGVILANLQ